jgi:DNA-binding response OmpR family regulator
VRLSDERPPASPSVAARPHLMIVDDRADDLDQVRAVIERRGYEPEFFSDPREALARTKDWEPAVAVLDYKMVPLNGVQLAEKLKALYPDILIIFVTSDKSAATRRACLRVGHDHILKPYESEDLLLRIEVALRTYDRYIRKARPFPGLTSLEQRAFDALLAGEGEVVARDELITALWGDDALDDDNDLDTTNGILDTTMCRLRARIEPGPGYPRIIVTRRGRGYLLELAALRFAYGDRF